MVSENGRTVCVTGAGGYIASWIVLRLLQAGYKVHGTARNPEKHEHLMKLEGAKERLKLFKADILDFNSLLPAVRGCDGVFHTSCPVSHFTNPEDVLEPAIKGTMHVLRACYEENIKRIVMTSSIAAIIGDENRDEGKIVDESCWSDPAYCTETKKWYWLAKTQSEKLAWDLAKEHHLDLIVICPVYVFGPLLQPTLNASSEILMKLVDGSTGSYSKGHLLVVDVRDVADSHVIAFERDDAFGRYLCAERAVELKEMIKIMRTKFPKLHYPKECESKEVSKLVTDIGPKQFSNNKLLSLIEHFVPLENTLLESISSLQDKGFLSI